MSASIVVKPLAWVRKGSRVWLATQDRALLFTIEHIASGGYVLDFYPSRKGKRSFLHKTLSAAQAVAQAEWQEFVLNAIET